MNWFRVSHCLPACPALGTWPVGPSPAACAPSVSSKVLCRSRHFPSNQAFCKFLNCREYFNYISSQEYIENFFLTNKPHKMEVPSWSSMSLVRDKRIPSSSSSINPRKLGQSGFLFRISTFDNLIYCNPAALPMAFAVEKFKKTK